MVKLIVAAQYLLFDIFDNGLLAFLLHPDNVYRITVNTCPATVAQDRINLLHRDSNYLLLITSPFCFKKPGF